MTFQSNARFCECAKLPAFSGTRIMMMPYQIRDPRGSLPEYLEPWFDVLERMYDPRLVGVGYLTIDEAHVLPTETHRRPGLHVDGVGPRGEHGGWGGGGGYGANGMRMVASRFGCRAFIGRVAGDPKANGDCEHLRSQVHDLLHINFEPTEIWECGAFTLHESIPPDRECDRQFCRVSYPSDSPWYEGYTPNPLGTLPDGPIHPARAEFMSYRS